MDGGGDGPVAFAQRGLNLGQDLLGNENILKAPFGLQRELQPVKIA